MNVYIRTDASVSIGSGHVMRCLTVARELQKEGYNVVFGMRNLPGNLVTFVQKQGFGIHIVKYDGNFDRETDAVLVKELLSCGCHDLCIVDHYEIDEKWEKEIQPYVRKIAVIDDLANRHHYCDLLLDQNMVPDFQTRYNGLVPPTCEKLLGPTYLIMREEFTQLRTTVKARTGEVKKLLVFMGGSDPTRETLKVIKALENGGSFFEKVDIVVGQGNPEKEKILSSCERFGFFYHCQIDYLASLMADADFSVGAGGSMTWERCYLGLPSTSTIVADNQLKTTETVAALGAVWNLGRHEEVTAQTYYDLFLQLSNHKKSLREMSIQGLRLTENPEGANPWVRRLSHLR